MMSWTRSRNIAAAVLLSLLTNPLPLRAAEDCPAALSGKGSFIVERGQDSKTEVFYGDGPAVRTTLRYRGQTLLETTLYEGLFELHRLDRGTKIEAKPKTDLGKLFPLKPKQKIAVDFDVIMSGRTKTKTVKLEYVGVHDYSLGECTYSVLKFRRSESWPIFYNNIDYYAPELKLVVAKEYSEPNGRTTIIGYNRISSVKP